MADTAVETKETVATPEKKVEEVEKKKDEEATEEVPSEEPKKNGHAEEEEEDEDEGEEKPAENGNAKDEKEDATENGTSVPPPDTIASKRKSTGVDEAEAVAEGLSPEKKAKLADKEEETATNGAKEAEATA